MSDEEGWFLQLEPEEPAEYGPPPEDPEVCCHCGSREGVRMEPSYTAYWSPPPTRFDLALEERPLDPNRDRPYCRPCAEDHKAFWDEQWKEYYGNL